MYFYDVHNDTSCNAENEVLSYKSFLDQNISRIEK